VKLRILSESDVRRCLDLRDAVDIQAQAFALLAAKLGATYTRYADDLTVSGDPALDALVRKRWGSVRAGTAEEVARAAAFLVSMLGMPRGRAGETLAVEAEPEPVTERTTTPISTSATAPDRNRGQGTSLTPCAGCRRRGSIPLRRQSSSTRSTPRRAAQRPHPRDTFTGDRQIPAMPRAAPAGAMVRRTTLGPRPRSGVRRCSRQLPCGDSKCEDLRQAPSRPMMAAVVVMRGLSIAAAGTRLGWGGAGGVGRGRRTPATACRPPDPPGDIVRARGDRCAALQ